MYCLPLFLPENSVIFKYKGSFGQTLRYYEETHAICKIGGDVITFEVCARDDSQLLHQSVAQSYLYNVITIFVLTNQYYL